MRSTSFKKSLRNKSLKLNKSLRKKSLRKKSFKSNRGGSRTISKRDFRRKSNRGFNRLQKGGAVRGLPLDQVKRLIYKEIDASTTTNTGDYIISKVEDTISPDIAAPYHILSVNVGVRAYYIIKLKNTLSTPQFYLEQGGRQGVQSSNSPEKLCLSFNHKSLPIPSEYISPLTGERITLLNKKNVAVDLKTLGDYCLEPVDPSAMAAVEKRTPLLRNETRTHILRVYLGFIHYKIQSFSNTPSLIATGTGTGTDTARWAKINRDALYISSFPRNPENVSDKNNWKEEREFVLPEFHYGYFGFIPNPDAFDGSPPQRSKFITDIQTYIDNFKDINIGTGEGRRQTNLKKQLLDNRPLKSFYHKIFEVITSNSLPSWVSTMDNGGNHTQENELALENKVNDIIKRLKSRIAALAEAQKALEEEREQRQEAQQELGAQKTLAQKEQKALEEKLEAQSALARYFYEQIYGVFDTSLGRWHGLINLDGNPTRKNFLILTSNVTKIMQDYYTLKKEQKAQQELAAQLKTEQSAQTETDQSAQLETEQELEAQSALLKTEQELAALTKEQEKLTEEQETLAEEKRKLAEEKETLAEEKRKLAEEKRKLAEEKRKLAEEKRTLAEEKEQQTELLKKCKKHFPSIFYDMVNSEKFSSVSPSNLRNFVNERRVPDI